MLRIIGIKTFLDGGMLTGSAYMRAAVGREQDLLDRRPDYRGVLFIPPERLVPIVRDDGRVRACSSRPTASATARCTRCSTPTRRSISDTPVAPTRPCITHSNFMSREAIDQAARLGVVVDIQPAWLYLDTRTLAAQFGYDRLRYFQPLKSLFEAGVIAGGGSDHMQKIGSLRSINPYNPVPGMWVAITRKAKGYEGRLHPEEALTREQAIRFYTINNAHLLFLEDQVGSLEAGKLADFVVLDRDLLTCPEDDIRDTKVLTTYLNGKPNYSGDAFPEHGFRGGQEAHRPGHDEEPGVGTGLGESPEAGPLPTGMTHHTYRSKVMGCEVGYCIYLPPGYDQEPNQRYPVIYNLHGAGGNEVHSQNNAKVLQEGIVSGKLPPMIMVMPNGGQYSFYKDSYDKKVMAESTLIGELIPHIDQTYRTIAAQHGRCIEGHSMGGRGATRLAMKHPAAVLLALQLGRERLSPLRTVRPQPSRELSQQLPRPRQAEVHRRRCLLAPAKEP